MAERRAGGTKRAKASASAADAAAAAAAGGEPEEVALCKEVIVPQRPLPPTAGPDRAFFITMGRKLWANGTAIRYYFYTEEDNDDWADRSPNGQDSREVRKAFGVWQGLCGLHFEEVEQKDDAEVRIAFEQGNGSWSYVGTDCLVTPADEPTMNFGWPLTTAHGRDTALHELGHAIGCGHEHQNPNAGIVWDEAAVLRRFSRPPNSWPDTQIRHNILRKLEGTRGSDWDPASIMHYQFGAGLIHEPDEYANGIYPAELRGAPGQLSDGDRAWVAQIYPPPEEAFRALAHFQSEQLTIGNQEERTFIIRPERTRKYTIQTFGEADTILVLFEDHGEENLEYITADDDSGGDYNAKIRMRLRRDKVYRVNVRLYHANAQGETAIMYW